MKVHKRANTLDGFILQVLRAIEDIEADNIREYQEKHHD